MHLRLKTGQNLTATSSFAWLNRPRFRHIRRSDEFLLSIFEMMVDFFTRGVDSSDWSDRLLFREHLLRACNPLAAHASG